VVDLHDLQRPVRSAPGAIAAPGREARCWSSWPRCERSLRATVLRDGATRPCPCSAGEPR
jgi:hypothetical protein